MVNSCCVPPDLRSNKFITNVYTYQDSKQCPYCGEDIRQELAKTIFETLLKKPTNLPFSTEVQLRAAFWSLSDHCHGTDRRLMTCFNIVHVAETSTGILATVRVDGGEVRNLAVSRKEFDEMVEDPSLVIGGNWGQIWDVLTKPSVGKAPSL